MLKTILAYCLSGLVSIVFAAPAFAQAEKGESTPHGSKSGEVVAAPAGGARPPANNSYDSRALRLESHWGRMRVVRGADGPVAGTAGIFRTADFGKIVAGSSRAESEARLFKAEHRLGAIASALGATTFVVGLVTSANNSNNAATPALIIGGAGAMFWGARRLNSAYSSLSRAVWWYNRDIVR